MSLSSGEPFQDVVRITEKREITQGTVPWRAGLGVFLCCHSPLADSHTRLTFDFHEIRDERREARPQQPQQHRGDNCGGG